MTKQIDGIPETITRQQYVEMVRSLGVDPSAVYWMRFDVDGITVEVVSKNPDGKAVVEGNDIAKHYINIPVVDK